MANIAGREGGSRLCLLFGCSDDGGDNGGDGDGDFDDGKYLYVVLYNSKDLILPNSSSTLCRLLCRR